MKRIVTTTFVALAMTLGVTSRAAAQIPFSIESPAIVTDANNSGVPGAAKRTDPNGSTKELGPLNGSSTKIGVIHNAGITMLSLTNPNGQVDLNAIWTQSKTTADGHTWFYFAWSRDSSNGSGFLSIELQKEPSDCDYTNNTTLLQCNPWANRSEGDFILLWDQSGSSREIIIRVFEEVNGALVLGAPHSLNDTSLFPAGTAVAEFSEDGFRGEAAIDLTNAGIFTPGTCQSFANTLPGTVTGNSDTADYKDAVLQPFPPVSNCGTVVVQKATQPPGQTGTFGYTLDATGDIFPESADSDCTVSGASKALCQGTLTGDGNSDTISDLKAGTYTLTEPTLPTGWTLVSISCVVPGDANSPYTGASFPVTPDATTTCTITNSKPNIVGLQTVQHATLRDTLNLSGILRAGNETAMTVSFKLYSDSECLMEVGTASEKTANTNLAVTPATASATTATVESSGIVVPNGTYYWRVFFSGNTAGAGGVSLNEPKNSACGSEVSTVSFSYNQ